MSGRIVFCLPHHRKPWVGAEGQTKPPTCQSENPEILPLVSHLTWFYHLGTGQNFLAIPHHPFIPLPKGYAEWGLVPYTASLSVQWGPTCRLAWLPPGLQSPGPRGTEQSRPGWSYQVVGPGMRIWDSQWNSVFGNEHVLESLFCFRTFTASAKVFSYHCP
jgi:hypothetical protein